MNTLTLAGLLLAFGAVLGGNFLEGGEASALFNLPALVIVLGGTVGAVMVQTPTSVMRRALSLCRTVFSAPRLDLAREIETMSQWSRTARRDGVLGLERLVEDAIDPTRGKGIGLVIDGVQTETIRQILSIDVRSRIDADMAAAGVFESMGGYAPTIGILGAVLGLIQVMGNLADPSQLGAGIATAFVATIYGVGFANLLFLPIADRLKALTLCEENRLNMYIEGVLAIAEGEHPRLLAVRLEGYLERA